MRRWTDPNADARAELDRHARVMRALSAPPQPERPSLEPAASVDVRTYLHEGRY